MGGKSDADTTSQNRAQQPHGHGRHPGLAGAQNHPQAGAAGGRAGGPGAPAAIRQASQRNTRTRPSAASSSHPAHGQTSGPSFAPSSAALVGSALDDSSDADLTRMHSRDVAPLPSLREGEQLSTAAEARRPSFVPSRDQVPSFNGPSRFPGGLESSGQPSMRLPKPASEAAESHEQASTLAEACVTPRRNAWTRWRWRFKEFSAELVASIVLLAVGTSVNCQVKLSQGLSQPAGSYPSQNWAWGFAVMSTIHLAGGISGAHCNPGITLSLALFRGFPWRLVPIYILAQLLGSFIGSGLGYVLYQPEITAYQGGPSRTIVGDRETGSLFATVPDSYAANWSAFVNEVVASAILAMLVLAIGDDSNSPPGDGMSGLILGLAVTMIGMAMGWQSGYAVNAARDLGARIMLSCAGYGNHVWTHNDYWWIYGPIAGTLSGAILGCIIYDLAIYAGDASPLNREWTRAHSMVAAARNGARLARFTPRTRGDASIVECGQAATAPSFQAAPAPLPSFVSAADSAKEEVRRRWRDDDDAERGKRQLEVIPESRRASLNRGAEKDGEATS
ncbi:Aquaporin (major intrinsic protein family) [Ceraceosorus bombacis]|uniref:Aquaporin (Major intrinsic protein family) n=1 Tax=Ceraceosorus bombacis TaxID=401625 RepID=A0A0P1BL66_9BASI|nr:Aquaporin (major intrinsic protein family) [Ceraceosorus bombacis]